MTDNAGRQTSYAYSSMGRLTQVSAGGRSFNYTYDILGRRTQLQYPNGMTVAYAYDARGRLTDIHCRDAANVTLERYTYTFDGADNITQVVDAATAKWTYAYDDRYRLTQAERYLGATLKHRYTYTYDGADNAATQAVYNASAGTTNSIAYTYNAGNELTQAVSSANGTTSYAYDLWGRLTGITRGTQSAALGWAYQDRLKSYTTTLTGERSVNFAYTGDGRRMGVDNTLFGAKSWSYDGAWGVRTQSYASLPDSSRWYIQEPWGTVLAEAPVSGVVSDLRYYVRDHLGSTRSVRRENTTKFCWFEYDPYGTTYASGGVTGFTQDRFTGHEFDMETNMYWAPYRYYRPDMLRWASRDPIGMVGGPNMYAYVTGRPTMLVDPMGLEQSPPRRPTSFPMNPFAPPSAWMGCPTDCRSAERKMREMMSEWRKKYPGESSYNNHMRHCSMTAESAQEFGIACAYAAGWVNEYRGQFARNDIIANHWGIVCSASPDYVSCCRKHAPKD